tara:strand:+ start:99 stop:596 length:498 start_codon:yes stop_codon:yes gene_type:complete
MYSVVENFLSEDECDYFISYYHRHRDIVRNFDDDGTFFLRFVDTSPFHIRKNMIHSRAKNYVRKNFPVKFSYSQIVQWPTGTFKSGHRDADAKGFKPWTVPVDWTSVVYLNDDYEGGQTLVENNIIKPKKGSLCVFNSKKLLHGVYPINSGIRYTYISWWEEIKK